MRYTAEVELENGAMGERKYDDFRTAVNECEWFFDTNRKCRLYVDMPCSRTETGVPVMHRVLLHDWTKGNLVGAPFQEVEEE